MYDDMEKDGLELAGNSEDIVTALCQPKMKPNKANGNESSGLPTAPVEIKASAVEGWPGKQVGLGNAITGC